MKNFFFLIGLLLFSNLAISQNFTVDMCSGGPPSSTTSNLYGPMYTVATANATNRSAYIIPKDQLTPLWNETLTSIYFHRATATGSIAGTPNFKIYLKEVSALDWGAGALDWTTAISGATLAFDGNPVSYVGTTAGWKPFPLSGSFTYTGANNLAVMVEYVNTTASTSIAWSYEYTSPCINTANSNTTKYINNTTGTPGASLTSSNYRRPYMGFDPVLSCYPPNGISASNITETTATLNWNEPFTPPSDGYDYYYNTTGTAPTDQTAPTGSTAPGITTVNLSNLTAGTNYFVWVRSKCTGSAPSDWVAMPSFWTLPANDDCIAAINIPTNPDMSCTNIIYGTTTGATETTGETPPTCSATGVNDDVWYTFTATSTTHDIQVVSNNNAVAAQLYSGVCGQLATMVCATTSFNNLHLVPTTLTIGTTYYLRIYSSSSVVGTTSDFSVCIGTPPGLVPPNDSCHQAIPMVCGTEYTGNNFAATHEVLQGTCGSTVANYRGVWYSLTANVDGPITINTCGTVFDNYVRVYSGTCAAQVCVASADAGCPTGGHNAARVTFQATAGTTYYILLSSYSLTQYGSFSIIAECPMVCTGDPANVSVTGITDVSATITWDAATPAPANGYDIYYSTDPTPPGANTQPNDNTPNTSITITGLTFNTTYYVWVRAYCFPGDAGDWIALPSFTTLPPGNCTTTTSVTPNPICAGGAATFSTSGAWVSYSWSGPNGFTSTSPSPVISNVQPSHSGNYIVTVVDANQCQTVGSVELTVNPNPVATAAATPNPICVGATLSLKSTGGGTYAWSGPGGFTSNLQNPTRTNVMLSHAGTYIVTVTSPLGCTDTASVAVSVVPKPTASATINPNPACIGQLAWFEAQGGTSYRWSGPGGFSSTEKRFGRRMESGMAGVYTVTVTSSAGCTATATVTATVKPSPTVTVTATPNPVCSGESVQLSATGGSTYEWKGPNGFNSTLQNPVINNVQTYHAGTYVVAVGSAECAATGSVDLEVKQSPAARIWFDDTALCLGDTLRLYAAGGGSYSWSGPGGWTSTSQNPVRPNASQAMSGVYSVTVTGLSGCSAVVSTNVTIRNRPVATAWTTTPEVCEGGYAFLFASGGVRYSWSGPYGYYSEMQNPIISTIPMYMSGRYTVTVYNEYGCTSTATVTVLVQTVNGQANATPNPVPFGGTLYLTASGGTSYQWTGPNGFHTNTQNPIIQRFSKANAGVYTVIISSSAGCSDTRMILVNIQGGAFGGTQSQIADGTFKQVYPNPANSLIKIEDAYTGEMDYTIFNGLGEISVQGKTFSGESIQIDQLTPGTYYIQWQYTQDDKPVKSISRFVKAN